MKQKKSQCGVFLSVLLYLSFGLVTIQARPDSFAPIVRSEKEKVVYISTSSVVERNSVHPDPFMDRFFRNVPQKQRQSALGSGFIISSDGYIVTNHHVIAEADKIEVQLYNGKTFDAEIVGKDKMTELALIKIDASKLPSIKWGDSNNIEVGDWVLAIGNPLGFDHTVTAGIISARGRNVFNGANTAYGQFLQTDAAINFGNSGGPLFNMDAEVIGINTAIAAGGQNLGFAIPSNLARKVIKQLRETGTVARGWLGVTIQDISDELAKSFELPEDLTGVLLNEIGDGSPAKEAGLEMGDIIVEFNGKSVNKVTQLQQYVAETTPGDTVEATIFRDGKRKTVTITVTLRPEGNLISLNNSETEFGMRLNVVTLETRAKLSLSDDYGLLVTHIDQTGIAWEMGLRVQDVILRANNQVLETVEDFNDIVSTAKDSKKPITLLVYRNGRKTYIPLPVE